eukprot:226422_1
MTELSIFTSFETDMASSDVGVREQYESKISALAQELSSVKLELQNTKQLLEQSNSSMIPHPNKAVTDALHALIGDDDIEDDLSDTYHSKRQLRGTHEDDMNIDEDETYSESSSGAEAALDQHIAASFILENMTERDDTGDAYEYINDVKELRLIISSLKSEIKEIRENQLEAQTTKTVLKEETIDLQTELVSEKKKYKKLLRRSLQFEKHNIDIIKDDIDDMNANENLIQNKLDLIQSLNNEFDKMREIIKKQQHIINGFNHK